MAEKWSSPQFILASSSPRRLELLRGLGLSFTVMPPNFDEIQREGEDPVDYALRNSIEKALTVLSKLKATQETLADSIIISADTIVLIDGHVLEKPTDPQEARRMLAMIAGRTHTVITALSIIRADYREHEIHSQTVATDVTLAPVSTAEIAAYVATGEPLDKAGSYAIQGKGGYMVASINGSYTNVVGLQLTDLVAMFREKLSMDVTRYFYVGS